mmetsp:Transcript_5741/g.12827  ORF Transcript_5741/g.12827 Transcript_5741/m.12827 type:complete len:242 (+) Transcript_5741:1112-1837(+)
MSCTHLSIAARLPARLKPNEMPAWEDSVSFSRVREMGGRCGEPSSRPENLALPIPPGCRPMTDAMPSSAHDSSSGSALRAAEGAEEGVEEEGAEVFLSCCRMCCRVFKVLVAELAAAAEAEADMSLCLAACVTAMSSVSELSVLSSSPLSLSLTTSPSSSLAELALRTMSRCTMLLAMPSLIGLMSFKHSRSSRPSRHPARPGDGATLPEPRLGDPTSSTSALGRPGESTSLCTTTLKGAA